MAPWPSEKGGEGHLTDTRMMRIRTKDTNWCPMQCKRDVVLDRWVEATRRQLGGWRGRAWDGQITPKSDLSLCFPTAGPQQAGTMEDSRGSAGMLCFQLKGENVWVWQRECPRC